MKEADYLVVERAGFLVIEDTALLKNGQRSVGVAPQYASSLGKTSDCQSNGIYDYRRVTALLDNSR